MYQEPRGFHATAESALHLAGRNAFLRRAIQIDRLEPYPHWNVAGLKDRAHPHRKRLAASAAVPQAGARRLALGARCFADPAAMRANRAVRPEPRFDVGNGGVFVGEMGSVEGGFHGEPLSCSPFYRLIVLCQV